MSAFLCSEKHISTLVFELAWREVCPDTPSFRRLLMDLLLQTNLDSLRARYPDDPESSKAEDYNYRYNPEKGLHPIAVYKLASCYEYQSCEHEGWKTSQAKDYIDRLREAVIVQSPEYVNAKWSLD